MRYEMIDPNYQIKVVMDVRRQKNIILHFRANELYISSPKKLSQKAIMAYLEKYKDKILSLKEDTNDLYLSLFGKRYILKIIKSKLNDYEIKDGNIYLFLKNPTEANIKKAIKALYNQEFSRVVYEKILEAKAHLKNFKPLSDKLDILNDVKINYYKTFLGRCFIKSQRIELSSYLAKYDSKYIVGVIYHEMTHLLEPSHNQRFHQILDTIYPENRILTKEMKSMNSIIIKDFL